MALQPTILDYFVPLNAFNDEDENVSRIWSELLYCYKVKYFGYNGNALPPQENRPMRWFDLQDCFAMSHPLHWDTFRLIMIRRGLTLAQLQKLQYRMWYGPFRAQFEAFTLQQFVAYVFTAEELQFVATRVF